MKMQGIPCMPRHRSGGEIGCFLIKPRHDLRSTSASLRRLAFCGGKTYNAFKNNDEFLWKASKVQSA
jgi:hypothetical protein